MKGANKRSDTIKLLIQRCELDQPSPGFTAVVMKEIMTEAATEVAGSRLKSLLSRHGLEKSPEGLADGVMTRVMARDFEPAFKPVISGKTWTMFLITAMLFIVWQIFSDQVAVSEPGITSYVTYIGSALTAFFTSVPSLYPITFLAISILLWADYLLKRQRNTASKS